MAEDSAYINVPPTRKQNQVVEAEEEPQRRLKVTVERVALLVLSVLLSACVIALIRVILYYNSPSRDTEAMVTVPDVGNKCTRKLDCDSGWKRNGKMCYDFSSTKSSWSQSRETCEAMGGALVKINSREEQTFLFHKVRGLMINSEDRFWIGLTDDETEGEWKWTDGSPLNKSLSFWFKINGKLEPDDWKNGGAFPDGEDCALFGELGLEFVDKCWFDQRCTDKNRFICEKEITTSPDCQ